MFTRISLIALLLLSPVNLLWATDKPASDASLKELLEITQTQKILDATITQLDTMLQNVFQQITAGQKVTPEMQTIFDKGQADIVAMGKEEFAWAKMEPMYLRIYRKSLSQSEVDGMIAFYKTPAGQAVINKIPLLVQNTLDEVSQMMGPMRQRAEQMQKELEAELQAQKSKTGG